MNLKWKQKRRRLISLTVTFAMLFPTMGAAAAQPGNPDAQPTVIAGAKPGTEDKAGEKAKSTAKTEAEEKHEEESGSEAVEESEEESGSEAVEESKEESGSEAGKETEKESETATVESPEEESGTATEESSEKESETGTVESSEEESETATAESPEKESGTAAVEGPEKESETAAGESPEKESETATAESSEKESETATAENSKKESETATAENSEKESETAAVESPEKESETAAVESPEKESETAAEESPEKESETAAEENSEKGAGAETQPDNSLNNSNNELSAGTENPNTIPTEAPMPDAHEHNWSLDWSYDEHYHWHECDADGCTVTDNSEKDGYTEHRYSADNICIDCGYFNPESQIALLAESAVPTYQEAYDAMIALKDDYPEGMTWTNFTPYGNNGPLGDSYIWHGGYIYGANRGVGCSAFAFILSDEAFGDLPARAVNRGSFTFEDVKVGDILRVNNNSHSVIVLQKSAEGVVVAEANHNKSVHWGRVISKTEVLTASFIITRYPENYIPPDDPDADEVAQDGTAGGLEWSLTNAGVLTISGNGAIPDYSPDNLPLWSNGNISTIVIEEGVTGIGNYAFYQSGALSIYIPDGIETIGANAFNGSKLISVTIPGSVVDIGNDAFRNCANLTSVTVSEGVEKIGERAFQGCTSLAYIDFPASITSVGAGAFTSCAKMTRVRFMPGSGTVALGDSLFAQCWDLTSVTLPQTADRISAGMFQSCSSLPSLYIPASVKEIGENPFTSCHFLKYIYFGGSEAEWTALSNPQLENSLNSTGTTVIFDVEFDDPFAADPDDPGDFLPDEEIPTKPDDGNNPSKPDGGNDPSQPDDGNDPSKPGDSNDPSKPDGGNDPSQPDDGNNPSKPGDSNDPSKPDGGNDPSQPGDGNDPSKPDGGNDPSQPGDSNDPSKPDGDNNPSQPDDGNNPSKPDGGNDPSQPDGGNNPSKPDDGNNPTEPDSGDSTHQHNWSKDWNYDQNYHWHECGSDCFITNNSDKDGYGAHLYGRWIIDVNATAFRNGNRHRDCTVCHYRQTESIPATGSSGSQGGNSGSSDDSSHSSSGSSNGGSGGSGKSDPPVSTTIRKNPDGSSMVSTIQKDGTVTTTATDTAGKVSIEVKLSGSAVSTASQNGQAVSLPISAVQVTRDAAAAPAITVYYSGNGPIKAAIPAVSPAAGTVAVIINADGSEEVIKASVPTENSVVACLPNGATVKLIDKSKSFSDVPAGAWYENAAAFISARDLFPGTATTAFAPDAPMTYAALITALAGFDGAETEGGATWYAKSMEWAATKGISSAANPDSNITCEEMVTALWEYLGSPAAAGLSDSTVATGTGSTQKAMSWAIENGIIDGFENGSITPQGQVSRAQSAQIIMNFIKRTTLNPGK